MEIRLLEYFLAVARERNITRAAHSLHISQPTLTTQIRNLEEQFGKPLLVRNVRGKRRIELTEEGMLLQKRAEEILALVSKTEREIQSDESLIAGDILIGAGETSGFRKAAKIMKRMQERYPRIRFHILSGNAETVLEQLEQGLLDFGLILGEIDQNRYQSLLVGAQDEWGVLMPKDSPLASRAKIRSEDLKDQPLILSRQITVRNALLDWFATPVEKLNIIAEYNLLYNASLMAEEKMGYVVAIDGIISCAAQSPFCFRPLEPKVPLQLHLVWKKSQVFSRACMKFLELFRNELESYDQTKPEDEIQKHSEKSASVRSEDKPHNETQKKSENVCHEDRIQVKDEIQNLSV